MSEALKLEPQETLIDVRGVGKTFMMGEILQTALGEIHLTIGRGEYVALCGASGSGKTTLLNLVGGLDVPTSGQIHIDGHNLSNATDDALAEFRAARLGYVFQTFNLLPVLTAIENVEYPLFKQKMSNAERRARAAAALALVGLSKHGGHRPSQLSGGQRQRVAIARAVVHNPSVLLADEPTANLDKKTAGEILDLFERLNREMSLTIVVATHDPIVMKRAGRRVEISDGKIQSC